MAFHSVVTMEKPLHHISLADWNARVNRLRNVADARRTDSLVVRDSSRVLRDESRIEGNWANFETNEAFSERIAELQSWREIIAKTYERLVNEIHALEREKVVTERQLESVSGPIKVISDMLTMRDSRLSSELTYDEPDKEIKNELLILENNQHLLADRCQKSWEKLSRLEDVRAKIAMEIENKMEAMNLEITQQALDRNSMGVTFKMDPLRNPTNCHSYESWLEHTKNLKQLAENEIADTAAMRETLFVCREKARTILLAQQERTEYSIRKRIFETQRARNELEFQQAKVKNEMEKAMEELQALDIALRDKANILKLAQTRLENRTQRRGLELCLDYVHDALCLEVSKQHEIFRCLTEKIDESREKYNLLSELMTKINVDLEKKEHALMTDKRTLDIRAAFKDSEIGVKVFNPSAQTDYNIDLFHMANLMPKF